MALVGAYMLPLRRDVEYGAVVYYVGYGKSYACAYYYVFGTAVLVDARIRCSVGNTQAVAYVVGVAYTEVVGQELCAKRKTLPVVERAGGGFIHVCAVFADQHWEFHVFP